MSTEKIKNMYSDEVRLALLEQSINNINTTLIRFEKRFDQLDERYNQMESSIKVDIRWLFSIMIGGFAGMFAIMAHGFHWY